MRICSDKPGICFSYEVCQKKMLGICTKKAWVEEFYDLNDPEVRDIMINGGWKFKRE